MPRCDDASNEPNMTSYDDDDDDDYDVMMI